MCNSSPSSSSWGVGGGVMIAFFISESSDEDDSLLRAAASLGGIWRFGCNMILFCRWWSSWTQEELLTSVDIFSLLAATWTELLEQASTFLATARLLRFINPNMLRLRGWHLRYLSIDQSCNLQHLSAKAKIHLEKWGSHRAQSAHRLSVPISRRPFEEAKDFAAAKQKAKS